MKHVLIAAALASSLPSRLAAQCETQLIEGPHTTWASFGTALALDGDRALIGAPLADELGHDAGMVHAYQWSGGTWVHVGTLTASDADPGDRFGSGVALDGDRALIGAGNDDGVANDAGAAYAFEWDGSAWTERAKLTPAGLAAGDFFGSAQALEGTRAVVAASGDDDLGSNAGAVYVFENGGGTWVERAKLTPPPGLGIEWFGFALALDEDRLLVGAPFNSHPSGGTGDAFVFEFRSLGWELVARLDGSNLQQGSAFGHAVALEDDRALVSSKKWTTPVWRGRVHTFESIPNGWTESQVLYRHGPIQRDDFGQRLDLQGDSLLVASPNVMPAGPEYDGAVYLHAWSPAGWVETAELVSPGVTYFGNTIARDGERALLSHGGWDEHVGAWSVPSFFDVACRCDSGAPCANVDPTGGCVNSTGEGAALGACGSPSVAQDDLTFNAHLLPDNQPALLFSGTQAGPGVPFSDGRLCANGVLRRLQTHAANAAGSVSFGPGLGSVGGWSAGDERLFQVWFRDNAGPCGSGSNLSSAVRVTFTP